MNVSKVASNSSDGGPGIGHKLVLPDGWFGVTQLMDWAKLLGRVFKIDLQHCPDCGGELKIIAAILEQSVIEKMLTHLGLQAGRPNDQGFKHRPREDLAHLAQHSSRHLTINIPQPRPWRRAVFIGESPATPRPSAPG